MESNRGSCLTAEDRAQLGAIVGEANVISAEEKVGKLSKDFYWYSPILKPQLEDKQADVVVNVGNREELAAVIRFCFEHDLPIVPRGAATGNYGQIIPIHGGVIIDFGRMDKIISLDGVAQVEPGARLGKIEPLAREQGWELRCLPSTWVKSTMGGFLCGGSGGVGSITWGGISAGDNMKSVTLMTVEAEPRILKFEEQECLKALHTYGTTGIMIEAEMRLAPKRSYRQMIVEHGDWDVLLALTDAIARDETIGKRLVTIFQKGIPGFFRPLKKFIPEDVNAAFFLIEEGPSFEAFVAKVEAAGAAICYDKELPDPPKPPYISDYTWNHTTLWALKADPTITYLQAGLGDDFAAKMRKLWDRFGDEIMFHLEWTASATKQISTAGGEKAVGETINVGGLPLVRFKSPERLQEIMDYCETIGVEIYNPHTYILEEGGRHPDLAGKQALKSEVDPKGLLNPGKMKTYTVNPFAAASA